MRSYAIIGFGCAGFHALRAIRGIDPEGVIDVYSEHQDPPYNPMLTTYYASNRLSAEGLFPFGDLKSIGQEFNANINSETRVTALDAQTKTITLADGTSRSYDRILIATGARAFVPPLPIECPEAVITMRNLGDARDLRARLDKGGIRRAVVIGASMAGIKVAEAFSNNGIPVVLGDMAPRIFPLAAYPETAERIEAKLKEDGLIMHFQKGLTAIHRGDELTAKVEFSDGTFEEADCVALCIGTRAATELAAAAGIAVTRAIEVNESMETSVPGIYAAGDCCQGNELQSGQHMIVGLWANAAYQGDTAGANMAGGKSSFSGNILHNITHFYNMDFIGFGDNRIKGEQIFFENEKKGLWIQGVLSEGKLVGINILGSYRISGILKNHILSIIQDGEHHISPIQRGVLLKEGLTEEFLRKLEGGSNGN